PDPNDLSAWRRPGVVRPALRPQARRLLAFARSSCVALGAPRTASARERRTDSSGYVRSHRDVRAAPSGDDELRRDPADVEALQRPARLTAGHGARAARRTGECRGLHELLNSARSCGAERGVLLDGEPGESLHPAHDEPPWFLLSDLG